MYKKNIYTVQRFEISHVRRYIKNKLFIIIIIIREKKNR